jgi:hypothetical protein
MCVIEEKHIKNYSVDMFREPDNTVSSPFFREPDSTVS